MSNVKTKCLVISAVMIALATVLSLIKIWEMPLGGSVTLLSMLPIVLLAIKYGPKWGLTTSFLYSIIQLALDLGKAMGWGLTGGQWVGMIIFDYILPYTILGLAGIFIVNKSEMSKKSFDIFPILAGIALVMVLRFASHVVSGSLIFDIWMPKEWNNAFLYSLVYNGSFMLPELIFTIIGASILFSVPQIKKLLVSE